MTLVAAQMQLFCKRAIMRSALTTPGARLLVDPRQRPSPKSSQHNSSCSAPFMRMPVVDTCCMQVLQGKTAIFGAFNVTLVETGDKEEDPCEMDPLAPGCPCTNNDDGCCDQDEQRNGVLCPVDPCLEDGTLPGCPCVGGPSCCDGKICPTKPEVQRGKARRALKQVPPAERLTTLSVSPWRSVLLPARIPTHVWNSSTCTPSPPTASLLSTTTQPRHVKE